MDGIAGDEPVAITKHRACILMPSISTVVWSVKRPVPAMTRTPRPTKRCAESFGPTAAITFRTWRQVLAKSTFGWVSTPKMPAVALSLTRFAAAINAFDGTQP